MSSNGMYLGIDIGGTKTLLAVFDAEGQIVAEHRFPTKPKYGDFIKDLGQAVQTALKGHHISACCCAIPGLVDRKVGVGLRFGNLDWQNVLILRDLQQLMPSATIFVENDANLAGLSEALQVQNNYRKVLYLTISTGIGDGIIIDGKIDPDFADSEPGQMILEHEGEIKKWESFASGKALKQQTGQLASQIDDPKVWQRFAAGLALGLNELLATLQPDVVIMGGGVGAHFEKFQSQLHQELVKLSSPLVPVPPIIKAKRPEEAVIYGCYDYIKQKS